jgi:tetratricopeptide (TPR) repeat protein
MSQGDPFREQDWTAWQALQDWLAQEEQGRSVLARFSADPERASADLAQWLETRSAEAPPQIANLIAGGQVEKLINIAQAGVVLIQQTLAAAPPSAMYQLPADIPDFVGREEQVSAVTRVLAPSRDREELSVRTVALAGMAGVGKSALAIHVAHQLQQEFSDAQLYVNLRGAGEQPMDAAEALAGFLHALGVEDKFLPLNLEARARLFRSLLAAKHALVLLDNAHDEAQVRPLLPGSPSCAVLITSRRRLSALEAEVLELDVLTDEDSLRLLKRLVPTDRVAEIEASPDSATELVQSCGRLPLAIRIAAGKLTDKRHWTLSEYTEQLADERGRLAKLQLGDLEVRSALGLSYRDMTEADAAKFRFLASVDREALFVLEAAAVWQLPMEDAQEVLERLADAQVLEPEKVGDDDWVGDRQYRIHDLVRLFATEELERHVTSDKQKDARRRAEDGGRLRGLHTFAFIKTLEQAESSWEEAVRSYEKVIKGSAKLGISDRRSEASILRSTAGLRLRLGLSAGEAGRWRKATRQVDAALETLKALPSRDDAAVAVAEEGLAYARRGRHENALECWRQAIAGIDPAYESLAMVKQLTDFLGEYQKKEELWRALGERAASLHEEQRWDEALEVLSQQEVLIREQMAVAERMGIISEGVDDKPYGLQVNYAFHALVFCEQGRGQDTQRALHAVASLASELGDEQSAAVERSAKAGVADCYRKRALSAWEEESLDEARVSLAAALELYESAGMSEATEVVRSALERLSE